MKRKPTGHPRLRSSTTTFATVLVFSCFMIVFPSSVYIKLVEKFLNTLTLPFETGYDFHPPAQQKKKEWLVFDTKLSVSLLYICVFNFCFYLFLFSFSLFFFTKANNKPMISFLSLNSLNVVPYLFNYILIFLDLKSLFIKCHLVT